MPGSSAEVGAASTSTRVLPLLLVKVSVSGDQPDVGVLGQQPRSGNPGSCTGCTGALARSRVNASKGAPATKVSGSSHRGGVAVGHAVLILRDQRARPGRLPECSQLRLSFLQGCLYPGNDHVESGAKTFGALSAGALLVSQPTRLLQTYRAQQVGIQHRVRSRLQQVCKPGLSQQGGRCHRDAARLCHRCRSAQCPRCRARRGPLRERHNRAR